MSNYFAPSARYGTPDDFRYLIDHLHQHGIGVIMDWVPAHFPKDAFALARFDGTALYEHLDPRKGEHPDWGTYIFNYGRNEVRNFLIANALLLVAASFISTDCVWMRWRRCFISITAARKASGFRMSLADAKTWKRFRLLKELNEVTHRECPGAMMIAEESTAWPAVSHPVYAGGLGF